jgi:transposase-like protein
MTRKVAPSTQKAQALAQWLEGQSDPQSGEALLSAFVRLATERGLQEALEQEQAEALGRSRYERQPTRQGYRNGSEDGTVKTAEGVFWLQLPPVRGLREPYRSKLWAALGRTRAVLTRLIVERSAGGRSPRDLAQALEKARGHCVVSKSAVSDSTARLSHADEALRTRARSGFAIASLFLATGYAPLRRWGSKTGGLCVWGSWGDGRKVLRTLSTAHRER